MDSHVLRLIRRYDPVGASTTGVRARSTLENTRDVWHTISTNTVQPPPPPPPSSSLSHLTSSVLQRSLTTNCDDELPIRPTTTAAPRLQRQQAVQEQESVSSSSTRTLRPILKYGSVKSQGEQIKQAHKTEPLWIEVGPLIPPLPSSSLLPQALPIVNNDSSPVYQPSMTTTATTTTTNKRVCSALSKSEWDLRLQQDLPPLVPPLPFPVRPPSPPLEMIDAMKERDTFDSPVISSGHPVIVIDQVNNDEYDNDIDEMSAPISTSHGSCVQKLKQLLTRKSSSDIPHSIVDEYNRVNHTDGNLDRRTHTNQSDRASLIPSTSSSTAGNMQFNPRITTTVHEPTPTSSPSSFLRRKPMFRSQTAIDRFVELRVIIVRTRLVFVYNCSSIDRDYLPTNTSNGLESCITQSKEHFR
jgi:hypothetical protein